MCDCARLYVFKCHTTHINKDATGGNKTHPHRRRGQIKTCSFYGMGALLRRRVGCNDEALGFLGDAVAPTG